VRFDPLIQREVSGRSFEYEHGFGTWACLDPTFDNCAESANVTPNSPIY
jgi:hypothetical protein